MRLCAVGVTGSGWIALRFPPRLLQRNCWKEEYSRHLTWTLRYFFPTFSAVETYRIVHLARRTVKVERGGGLDACGFGSPHGAGECRCFMRLMNETDVYIYCAGVRCAYSRFHLMNSPTVTPIYPTVHINQYGFRHLIFLPI